MTSIQIGMLGIGALVVLIGLRVPIGIALIGVSFFGTYAIVGDRAAWGMLRAVPYGFTANWALSSVPMFLLMGYVCYHAGLTKGLFEAARAWLSRLPGGTAVSAIFGAAGFAAVTGSSVACAAAMGRIAVPEMLNQKYDPGLAAGSVAAAGTLGALIPPSILLIVYGIMAQVSIGQLFLGGLVIGLLSVASYVALIIVRVWLNPALAPSADTPYTWKDRFALLADTWPVLILMLGVMGGLFGGLFTATEAGGCGAALAILIAFFKRSLSWDILRRSLVETVMTTTSIFIIAMGASLLARFVTLTGISDYLGDLVTAAGLSPLAVILLIVVFYLVLGMFLEPIGAMLVTLPIVLPLVDATGASFLWFGILLAKVLETGMLTPPIGLNVFVIKSVVGDAISLARIFQGVTWFIVADLVVIALSIAFPDLIMFLPLAFAP